MSYSTTNYIPHTLCSIPQLPIHSLLSSHLFFLRMSGDYHYSLDDWIRHLFLAEAVRSGSAGRWGVKLAVFGGMIPGRKQLVTQMKN